MAETNYLVEDFKEVTENSDDAVFEILKQKKRAEASKKHVGQAFASENTLRKSNDDYSGESPERTSLQKSPIHASHTAMKPVAVLNTRIPQELSDLIDDLVYQSKKRGQPTSKQAIAIEALWSHFKSLGFDV